MTKPKIVDHEGNALPDGLYRVDTPWFVAGFVVEDAMIVRCAPILARVLSRGQIQNAWWLSRIQRLHDDEYDEDTVFDALPSWPFPDNDPDPD